VTEELRVAVGHRVKERRLACRLTRDRLASSANPHISDKYLWEIETGKKSMSADILRRLAIALDVTSDWLLGLPERDKDDDE